MRRVLWRAAILASATCLGSCAPKPPPHAAPTTQPLASPRDLPGVPNFAEVSPTLFRGAQPTAAGFARLHQMGIKTIIDLRGRSHRDDPGVEKFRMMQIPTDVAHPDLRQLAEFLRIVDDPASRPVFVHDDSGADRTGLYAAVYRMAGQGWTARDAEAELPRFGFNPYWHDVPEFLDRLDVTALRKLAAEKPATAPAETRPTKKPRAQTHPARGADRVN